MDEVNKIRQVFKKEKSLNKVAKKFNCSWATAKKLVTSPATKLSQQRLFARDEEESHKI